MLIDNVDWIEIQYPKDYIPSDFDPFYYKRDPDGRWHFKDGDGVEFDFMPIIGGNQTAINCPRCGQIIIIVD
jgi:hypothetical protein